jgi:alkylhydroperoxidase family enzyme
MLALNEFEQPQLFSEKDRAALAYTREIAVNNRRMRSAVKDCLKAKPTDSEIVDLTLVCCMSIS